MLGLYHALGRDSERIQAQFLIGKSKNIINFYQADKYCSFLVTMPINVLATTNAMILLTCYNLDIKKNICKYVQYV